MGATAKAKAKAKASKEQSTEQYLKETRYFRSNAEVIIEEMKELNDSRQGRAKLLVDEILHSIFFLGRIHSPPISPERLVNKSKRFDELKKQFPRPFELYLSQLPRRTPFSCVLDMIVFLEGRKKEEEIKQKLQDIISKLHLEKTEPLVSSTICISQNTENPNSEKYTGSPCPLLAGILGESWLLRLVFLVAGTVMLLVQ